MKAEAGRGGILRSINISATCPAMWRLTFSGGGHLVRLSANGCQPHRPNTALLFCAAGYHPCLLYTSAVQAADGVAAGKADGGNAGNGAGSHKKLAAVLSVLLLCVLYYVVLGEVSIPRVTIGILSFSITISIFEVATIVFLIAMMAFMGVRKVPVLILVPVCTSLFLSIAFRTCLHVMLP